MSNMIDLRQGDCLEVMKGILDGSVDLILTDPPYKTTSRGSSGGTGGNGNGYDDSGACYTLTTNDRHAVVYCGTQNDALRDLGIEICPTLRAGHGGGAVNPMIVSSVVRRLTPIECEKLQGFPVDFTKIPYRNKSADDCPNGVRYKALGNSMAVNVMAWIGQRVQATQGVRAYT